MTAEHGDGEHKFDRRRTDVNVEALAMRMSGLELRVETLEEQGRTANRELQANTKLTMQVHEAIFGRGTDEDDTGLAGKVKAVHDVFTDAKRGFAFLNGVADAGARWGKPIFWFVAICGAGLTYWKTGAWRWPPW